jgi:hypothetical protein
MIIAGVLVVAALLVWLMLHPGVVPGRRVLWLVVLAAADEAADHPEAGQLDDRRPRGPC